MITIILLALDLLIDNGDGIAAVTNMLHYWGTMEWRTQVTQILYFRHLEIRHFFDSCDIAPFRKLRHSSPFEYL